MSILIQSLISSLDANSVIQLPLNRNNKPEDQPDRPWAGYRPPSPPRGNFVHYDFLKLHYIRHKIKDVSPLRVAALTCNSTLYTLPPKIALNVPDNVSTMTCSYIFACWHRIMNFLYHSYIFLVFNVLSNYRSIRYLVFPALFLSISMVFIDYTCITSITEYSKSIRLLLKWFKVLYYGRLHYFSGPCYVCYLQNSMKHLS